MPSQPPLKVKSTSHLAYIKFWSICLFLEWQDVLRKKCFLPKSIDKKPEVKKAELLNTRKTQKVLQTFLLHERLVLFVIFLCQWANIIPFIAVQVTSRMKMMEKAKYQNFLIWIKRNSTANLQHPFLSRFPCVFVCPIPLIRLFSNFWYFPFLSCRRRPALSFALLNWRFLTEYVSKSYFQRSITCCFWNISIGY